MPTSTNPLAYKILLSNESLVIFATPSNSNDVPDAKFIPTFVAQASADVSYRNVLSPSVDLRTIPPPSTPASSKIAMPFSAAKSIVLFSIARLVVLI